VSVALRRCVVMLAAALAATVGAGCGAREPIAIHDFWARATPAGATVGAAYVRLESAAGDRLVRVSVPASVARAAQIHEVTRDAAGRLGMHEVAGVDLPPGHEVALEPGGMHVMLVDLVEPLAPGRTIDVTLTFRNAGAITRSVPVREE